MTKWKIYQDREPNDDEIDSFSLTLNDEYEGWNTDSGYGGYGLPKELAQWICDALNESKIPCPYKMNEYGDWRKK